MSGDISLASLFNEIISLKKTLISNFNHDDKIPLNSTEARTLMMIFKEEGKSMNYYSGIVDLENGSFTYAADILEKKGLIVREDDLYDRRKKILVLTDSGRQMTKQLEDELESHFAQKLSALSEKDKAKLFHAVSDLKEINDKIKKG